MICDNIGINELGHLTFAGYDTVELAKKYGTPLYLMDEDKIRSHARTYKTAMAEHFPAGSLPEYASKAFSCRQIYRIMAEEGIDVDVVSPGEIATAYSAGFPMEKCFFHGNNKSDADIAYAMDKKVGYIVVDSEDELIAVNKIAGEKGLVQNILLRLSPGIDPHTHKKISTGSVDSKFGTAIETGQAAEITQKAIAMENLKLLGFHCHIGSQIFDSEPFDAASEIMLGFIAEMKNTLGFEAEILNLGGGFGVRYLESDPLIDYAEKIGEVAEIIKNQCKALGISIPKIQMEPGRSLVADAGMTLYTVGSVKEIRGYKNYVSIDGGMTDNPRFALYESPYTVITASLADKKADFTASIAGRCCESGDMIKEDALIARPSRGDILAVLTTGAYNYSMASHYNRVPKAAVVMLSESKEYIAVRREGYEDLCALDL